MNNNGNIVFNNRRKKSFKKKLGIGCFVVGAIIVGVLLCTFTSGKSTVAKNDENGISPYEQPEGMAAMVESDDSPIVSIISSENVGNESLATGVIFDEKGMIITSKHAIEESENIGVKLSNGEVRDGNVIGYNNFLDLAVVKIEGENLNPIKIANEDAEVGKEVYLVQSGEESHKNKVVAKGKVVSSRRQTYVGDQMGRSTSRKIDISDIEDNEDYNTCIFINELGNLVGINSKKIKGRHQESTKLAFVDISDIKNATNKIVNSRKIKNVGFGIYGGTIVQGEDGESGIYIQGITKGTEADKAGLRPTDILLEINGESVGSIGNINEIVEKLEDGNRTTCKIKRNKVIMTMEITLGY